MVRCFIGALLSEGPGRVKGVGGFVSWSMGLRSRFHRKVSFCSGIGVGWSFRYYLGVLVWVISRIE